jgi:2-polyprenyl-3-methyl-5-hydroxy-6-metoxy-1,4-benzoquinol methylase
MYEKVEKCPICKEKSFENSIICKDYSVSKESFAITKCKGCGLLLTNPRPDESVIGNYYESEDYISHSDKANNLINLLYKTVRYFTLRNKRKTLERLTSTHSILDYGCGTGDFISHCKDKGWETTGVEPNAKARQIAIDKVGDTVYPDSSHIEKKQTFGVITLWHVLEHVHDINNLLKTLKKRLEKNGYMIIAVPNNDSYDAYKYKEHWAAYDVPRHLYHFNQQNIKQLATKHDMKLVETIPMLFDSYYVSMLSEKYKTGKSNIIKSFLIGWKSNRWANKNNKNYSSLIYVLKKK